ncbi:MAG: O-methyltransferase [Bdellovibrionota bacterium]
MREKKYSVLSTEIDTYVHNLLKLEQDVELTAVLENAKKRGTPPLQMTAADVRHLEVLARSIQAKNIVEIGTLCGYSTVCLARTLPQGGKIYTLERSEHHAAVAKEIFTHLGLDQKIELVFGEALSNLQDLTQKGPFDIVFIDADKDNYPNYFDWAVENLRPGGLLIADNVFVFGHIAQNPPPEGRLGELVHAMLIFNDKCANDPRLLTTFLPTGEGLMVAVRV